MLKIILLHSSSLRAGSLDRSVRGIVNLFSSAEGASFGERIELLSRARLPPLQCCKIVSNERYGFFMLYNIGKGERENY